MGGGLGAGGPGVEGAGLGTLLGGQVHFQAGLGFFPSLFGLQFVSIARRSCRQGSCLLLGCGLLLGMLSQTRMMTDIYISRFEAICDQLYSFARLSSECTVLWERNTTAFRSARSRVQCATTVNVSCHHECTSSRATPVPPSPEGYATTKPLIHCISDFYYFERTAKLHLPNATCKHWSRH